MKKHNVTHENIDDLIEEWHTSDPNDKTPLHEFLGMTQEEYFHYAKTDELPVKDEATWVEEWKADKNSVKKTVILATHNGTFHADDVFAYAVLKTVFPAHELVRTRNTETLSKADIVFDVGGGSYDHHSTDKRYRSSVDGENGTPYAAFGLIWKDLGDDYLRVLGVADAGERKTLLAEIDKGFVEAVDAFDNGVEVIPADRPNPIAVKTASNLISDFNVYGENEELEQVAFQMATNMAEIMLKNTVSNLKKVLDEKSIVAEAYGLRENKKLLILPTGCSWKRSLAELDEAEEVKFVVYPDSNEGYRIQVVTVSPDSFEARKDLPAEWAGKRDEELGLIIGIDDAVFCHPGRFLAGARSLKSILKMADQALNA